MPRSIWTGAISFGLVNVPVKLFTATEDKDIRFHQFRAGTGERIRYKRVAEESGDEVPYEDVVKGYEVAKGEYVIVTPDELDAAAPERTRAIEIEDFVDLDEIDPVFFQRTYYVAPADDSAAKPYELLRSAMAEANRVGISRFVMRGKEYLAAVRVAGEILVLETMYFADEVRDPADIDEIGALTGAAEVSDRERAAAGQLVESLTSKWEPERYHDTYREEVLALIERKARGEEIVAERPAAQPRVADLMEALEASIAEARQGARARRAPLEELSKEELYEEAQRRDISGRSRMDKDELIHALEEAS